MWSEVIEYLKDATLVAKIQEIFGVEIHYAENLREHRIKQDLQNDVSEKIEHCSNDRVSQGEVVRVNGYSAVKRKPGNATNNDESREGYDKSPTNHKNSNYTIRNYCWYYLFLFGTELGDEVFYSAFITFWFWNIDGAVGRRVILVWAIVMTVGQMLKDVICWSRPACPPAVRLQSKWSQEYGMPSTHAMVAVSIPFGVLLYTMNRYIYPLSFGCTIALLWCTLVCTSRIYLGMHTVLDILAGLILALALMVPLIPLVDITDYYLLSNGWALMSLISIGLAIIVYYPCSEKWTPTRGDTTMVLSVMTGVHVGAWLNYSTGAMSTPIIPPPYQITWLTYSMLCRMILRTVLGFCCICATKTISKSLSYTTLCAILRVNSKELMESNNCFENKNKIFVDLVYKYISCFMIGINTVYFLPKVFTMIGIERPTFYMEI